MNIKSSRKYSLVLPDNRTFNWYESGPIEGNPVLFCTGAGMSGLLGLDVELLNKFNIRLIIPTRPGLGDSSFDPNKSLKSFSEDVLYLMNQHLKINSFNVLGFSQGAVYAMALSVYGNINHLTIVAGQDQFDYPATQKQLVPDVINMLEQAKSDPNGLASWVQQNITAEWLMSFILNYSAEVDLAVYQLPEFQAIYQACMNEAFKQGNQGYTQDLLISMRPWDFLVEDISCATTLMYGLKDTSTVHSPDFGEVLFNRIPNSERHIYPEEGGSLLWTKTEDVLRTFID